ncbi:sugar ABC transporter substrate-binding protein [Streptomyces sp. NPDC090106]|uniref:sugar ABC transporter substrate-binding protein n=1 Tax=Streptomyces sp. NPDC090106 TaxID=3365946 RepID=UPI0037FA17BF
MNTPTPRTAPRPTRTALAVAVSALLLTSCGAVDAVSGSDGGETPKKGDDMTIGLLLPDTETKRFEQFDHPLIKKRVADLTDGKGTVRYANAGASAKRQSAQFRQMISDKVDAILVDAVDAKAIATDVREAKDAGIPVIAYDRLAEGPVDAYISHDNELVGEVQGRALIEALGDDARTSKIVMLNGSPADPNTARFKEGALGVLQNKVVIAKSYDVDEWLPKTAKADMQQAIKDVGLSDIAAVYSANDGMAGAAVEALRSAGATTVPPVTGQDADLAAVQRVLSGEQYMTVYKSFLLEATNAAEIAVAKVKGQDIVFDALAQDTIDSPTQKDIPANLVPVVTVQKENIEDTVIKDGVYTAKQICTAPYAEACREAGIK